MKSIFGRNRAGWYQSKQRVFSVRCVNAFDDRRSEALKIAKLLLERYTKYFFKSVFSDRFRETCKAIRNKCQMRIQKLETESILSNVYVRLVEVQFTRISWTNIFWNCTPIFPIYFYSFDRYITVLTVRRWNLYSYIEWCNIFLRRELSFCTFEVPEWYIAGTLIRV